jgi:photosystem II stability/assembly factor-like uncharacterized protein
MASIDVGPVESPKGPKGPSVVSRARAALASTTARSRMVLLVGLGLALAATVIAYVQPLRPDALRTPNRLSWRWWISPVERNAFVRVPHSSEEPHAVFTLPDGKHVWAAGAGGMVLRSSDGGRTWSDAVLSTTPEPPAAAMLEYMPATEPQFRLIANFSSQKSPPKQPPQQRQSQSQADPTRDLAEPDTTTPDAPDSTTRGVQNTTSGRTAATLDYPTFVALCFADKDSGWVIGKDAVFHTVDGGVTWEQQRVAAGRLFTDIACTDPETAWLAEFTGRIFRTIDGGQTWTASDVGTNPLYTVAVSSTNNAIAAGAGAKITADGGQSWNTVELGSTHSIRSISFTSSSAGFAVGGNGFVAQTTDRGNSWTTLSTDSALRELIDVAALAPGTAMIAGRQLLYTMISESAGSDQSTLNAVTRTSDSTFFSTETGGSIWSLSFAAAETGWISAGGIHRTDNAGATWVTQLSAGLLYGIAFRDSVHGLAVGDHGLILSTSNGGVKWKPRRSGTSRRLTHVFFLNDTTAWALPAGGGALVSRDGGRTWQASERPVMHSAAVRDGNGWGLAVAGSDSIVVVDIGGERIRPSSRFDIFAGIPSPLSRFSIAPDPAVADTLLWALDDIGRLYVRAGGRWTSDSILRFRDVARASVSRGYALDRRGSLQVTRDGGATWNNLEPVHTRQPAPWYYAALLFATTISALAFRRRAEPQPQQSIADVLVSDRPWRAKSGDRDALGFRDVARGIAQFLANRRTQPPITIAIVGLWGTGKSSLMNMLHYDLRRRNFYPIWFNAWHHQREESLLAALFEGIRQQGIPPVWTRRGTVFRAKLLWSRVGNYPMQAGVTISVFVLALGYFLADPRALIDTVRSVLTGAKIDWSESFGGLLSVLGAAGGTIITYVRTKPFGRKPSDLLNQMRRFGGLANRAADTGFRYSFARDFKEVADALKPYPMVIFVDDLDRCKPEQVMEVLESINFLQTCGDVVIVIGMDRDRVIGCVGWAYREVAVELNRNDDADINRDGKVTPEESRAHFARQYLEKLINIEVPVPEASTEGLQRVSTGKTGGVQPIDEDGAATSVWVSRASRLARAAAIVLAVGSLLWFGALAGNRQRPAVATQSGLVQTLADTGQAALTPTSPTAVPEVSLESIPASITTADAGSLPLTVSLLPLLLFGIVLVYAARATSETVVDDSDTFREALDAWSPALFAKLTTPRSAKKFMNRVRFLAMLQRKPARPRTHLQRLHQWAVRTGRERTARLIKRLGVNVVAEVTDDGKTIPEDQLVSLCVIREIHPEWMDKKNFWTNYGSFLALQNDLPAGISSDMAKFKKWGPLSDHRQRFEALISSIRLH